MNTERGSERLPASLCESCVHVRVIESNKGSRFLMCGRARDEPRFPKYPPQPVLNCVGYAR